MGNKIAPEALGEQPSALVARRRRAHTSPLHPIGAADDDDDDLTRRGSLTRSEPDITAGTLWGKRDKELSGQEGALRFNLSLQAHPVHTRRVHTGSRETLAEIIVEKARTSEGEATVFVDGSTHVSVDCYTMGAIKRALVRTAHDAVVVTIEDSLGTFPPGRGVVQYALTAK